jgi:serine/threonine-protein kinase
VLRIAVVAKAHTLLRNLVGWSGSDGTTDARAFLQERVRLYIKTLFFYTAGFYLLGRVGILAATHSFETAWAMTLETTALLHLGLVAGLGLDWWYLCRGKRSMLMLHAYESLGTIAVCVCFAAMIYYLPSELPTFGLLMATALTIVIRAAVVPSSAPRTFLVSILAVASGSIALWFSTEPATGPFDFDGREMMVPVSIVWGLAFSAASALTSRVIYGLQAQMREAMQLGQYQLVEKIGEGGMGAVYRAEHALLRRPTAIKLLPPEKAGEHAIARFEREVVHTSRLCNPNTVAIYDFGRTPDGIFYYAMEYLEGIDLQELIELDGPQPPERVIHILRHVAESLGEAHAAGLVHRDVKPPNVLLCDRGGVPDTVKVVDFGLVKDLSGGADVQLSAQQTIAGTPLYMAPEAIMSPSKTDHRADLYALGAVGYYLLTGAPPFDGESVVEVCSHHLHTAPIPPSQRAEGVPQDLEAVVLRLLAKKPDDRPNDTVVLCRELDACAAARNWTVFEAREWWTQRGDEVRAHRAKRRAERSQSSRGVVTVALEAKLRGLATTEAA